MAEQEENLDNQQTEQAEEEQATPETEVPMPESATQPQQENSASLPVFPSASLLLDCAKDEYTKERERTQFLDNKASFFMSAIILVATIFVPFIPFDKVRGAVTTGTELQKAIAYIAGTLVLVSFVFLVIAFKKLYDAYKIKGYERFNIENIVDIGVLTTERNTMEKALCENYKETIGKNIKSNDDKATKVSDGIGKCAIGFLLLAISAIILKVFIG